MNLVKIDRPLDEKEIKNAKILDCKDCPSCKKKEKDQKSHQVAKL